MPEATNDPCTCAECLLAAFSEGMDAMDKLVAQKPFDAFAGQKAADRVNRVLEDIRQAGDMIRSAVKDREENPELDCDVPGFDDEDLLEVVVEALAENVEPLFPEGVVLTLVGRWVGQNKTFVASTDGNVQAQAIEQAVLAASRVPTPKGKGGEKWN